MPQILLQGYGEAPLLVTQGYTPAEVAPPRNITLIVNAPRLRWASGTPHTRWTVEEVRT